MKIGILTFHRTMNYGSFLQTLGLYHALTLLHYDCEIIDYRCPAIEAAEFPPFKLESLSPKKVAKYILVTRKLIKKHNNYQNSLLTLMKMSPQYSRNNIGDACKRYDAILVGSDILWDLNLTGDDYTYFLDFLNDNNKKYAFATSVGGRWQNDKESYVIRLLEQFVHISLREESTAIWLRDMLKDKQIYSVCDPTMLCDASYWNLFSDEGKCPKYRYVLVYFYSDRIFDDAMEYAKKNRCKVVFAGSSYFHYSIKNIIPSTFQDFLALIKGAEAVFTASYHGMLFSLYFKKKLYIYLRNNEGHNIRMTDVINKLQIKEACSYSNESEKEIDYKEVEQKIKEWKDDSLKVLKGYWG